MLGEVTHLQAIVDDLTALTEDPHKLPPASEQVAAVTTGDLDWGGWGSMSATSFWYQENNMKT